MESPIHEPRRRSNRVSPLDQEDSSIAATNSTLYVANLHATMGAPNDCVGSRKVPTTSQVLFQYNSFASERPQVEHGYDKLLLAPGAI